MKKIVFPFFAAVLACSAVALSCSKEIAINDNESNEEVSIVKNDVHIIANNDLDTKTLLADDGADGFISKWESTDQIGLFQVYEKAAATNYIEKVLSSGTSLSDSDRKADFTVTLSDVDGGSNYKYVAVYPAGAATRNEGDLDLVIPATQTFGTTTFDKSADIMVSERIDRASYSSDALEMGFARVGSIVCLTIKGLTAGETVDQVVVSTTETGKYLAGTIKYDISAKVLKDGITEGTQTLTLNAPTSTVVPVGGSLSVWFRCAEVELTEDLIVSVTTSNGVYKYVYSKNIDLAGASKTLGFQSGHLARFSVSSLKRGPGDGLYVVHYVTDAPLDKLMNGEDDGQSYRKAIDNSLSLVSGRYNATSSPNAIWKLEYDRSTATHAFYAVNAEKYLTKASGLGTSYGFALDDNGDRTFNIMTTDATPQHMGYNSGVSPVRFKVYSSGSSIDTVPLTFTPAYANPVGTYTNINLASPAAVSSPASQNPTAFKFANSISLVGVYSDSEMTVSTDWVSISVANSTTGALTYTATANTGSARTAYVKLTALGDNGTSSTVSFTVSQAAKGVSVTKIYHETFGNNTSGSNQAWSNAGDYVTWTSGTYATMTIASTTWSIGKNSVDVCGLEGSSGYSAAYRGGSSGSFELSFGDLSAFSKVEISFNWHNNAGGGKARTFSFQVSGDGGANWGDNLINVASLTTTAWRNCTYEIPAAKLGNLKVKFSNTSSNVSRIDDVIVNVTSTE